MHDIRVTKNITFSADSALVSAARKRAAAQERSLNELFRQWLEALVREPQKRDDYRRLMSELDHVDSGCTFTRDELNAR